MQIHPAITNLAVFWRHDVANTNSFVIYLECSVLKVIVTFNSLNENYIKCSMRYRILTKPTTDLTECSESALSGFRSLSKRGPRFKSNPRKCKLPKNQKNICSLPPFLPFEEHILLDTHVGLL